MTDKDTNSKTPSLNVDYGIDTKIDSKLVTKLADLARLELTDQELGQYTQQLGAILKYIDKLNEIDFSKFNSEIEPLTQPFSGPTPLRADIPNAFQTSTNGAPKILESAPEQLYGGIKVPPIL